jgi:SAM-dependent methyltransferase
MPPARSTRGGVALSVLLFTGTSLLGATLLFAVQPMVAKMLLPSYGGSPMVWNTAMLFFQSALLAGYGYAHWAQRGLGVRWQPVVQIGLVALPILLLPIALPPWGVPDASAPPALWLLLVLTVMVGAPFAVLATTSPLIQRWYSWSGLPRSHDPYFLFAASNTGSLLALLAYPVLIETTANVATQARWWAAGYGAFAALMVTCALVVRFTRRSSAETPPDGGAEEGAEEMPTGTVAEAEAAVASAAKPAADAASDVVTRSLSGGDDPSAATGESAGERGAAGSGDARAERIGWPRRLRWLGLAFIPSSLMLGVTTHISTDIAPVPLLWVVPLALYLLTFIVAFGGVRRRVVMGAVLLAGGLAIAVPWVLIYSGVASLFVVLPLDLILLVVAGIAGHGLLAIDRPSPRRLTEFYLVVSVGGALGGLFNGLLAPVVFDWVIEFPIMVALLAVFPLVAGDHSAIASRLGRARQWVSGGVMIGGTGLVVLAVYLSEEVTQGPFIVALLLWACALGAVARPRFLLPAAVGLAVLLVVHTSVTGGVLERTFFGSYRIDTDDGRRTLSHGTTVHGSQFIDAAKRRMPTSYYSKSGPLGDVFARGWGPGTVGVIGLGAGTIAAYGQPGQRLDYYEIDPVVVRFARDPRYFTYLRDCPCAIRTIVGDGRLRIAEVPDGTYGTIILDAFTSDAIPVHLLTKEALQLYVRKLRPGGVIAIHVSNRYLDLAPMLDATARDSGYVARAASHTPSRAEAEANDVAGSTWVAVARSDADLSALRTGARATWSPVPGGGPVWTDRYSSLFGILKFD